MESASIAVSKLKLSEKKLPISNMYSCFHKITDTHIYKNHTCKPSF